MNLECRLMLVSETSLYENDRVVPTIEKLKAAGYTYEEEGGFYGFKIN